MPRGFWHPKLRKPRIPISDRLWAKVNKSGPICQALGTPCWEWTGSRNKQGYGAIAEPDTRGMKRVHRVSWELANGPIPPGLDVLHRCDNPPCVRPDHLFLGTDKDNRIDCARKGRLRPPESKLSVDDVRAIRRRVLAGETQGIIATDFGINQSQVSRVASGRRWNWISEE